MVVKYKMIRLFQSLDRTHILSDNLVPCLVSALRHYYYEFNYYNNMQNTFYSFKMNVIRRSTFNVVIKLSRTFV